MVRELLVTAQSGKKPLIVQRMNEWHYLERSLHRLVAAWARRFPDWEDKRAVCRHVWEQAECVRRLRERLVEFPGTSTNLDAPVSARLEHLTNTVLLAPTHQDAVDGVYQILTGALVHAYLRYVEHAHPVHDAPTVAMLQEIVRIKEQQRLWLRDYRRRYPHTVNAAYRGAIEAAIADCADFRESLPVDPADPAQPVGVRTGFRLPAAAASPFGGFVGAAEIEDASPIGDAPKAVTPAQRLDFMPCIERDFVTSIEARRLFWMYGYMLEQGLADDQMTWIWASHSLPWEFQQDVSRHLWDESRHGDSGYSRFLDFGFVPERIGFANDTEPYKANYVAGEVPTMPTLTPRELYDRVFFIGMCAETGHFAVKHEAYADFKDGGDLESAEMVLFDIIDETSHVQYAHHWLPMLAERADVDPAEFRDKGRTERDRYQQVADTRLAALQATPLDTSAPQYVYYQRLLQILRDKQPLTNANTCPPRSFKPM
jgi:hypothetical protein